MTARLFPAQDKRVETGPIQFGDDWPGVFIRGDNAGFYAFMLKRLIQNKAYDFPLDVSILLRNLHNDMSAGVIGPAAVLVGLSETPESGV